MNRLGLPSGTLALIGANGLTAAVQGHFQFVLIGAGMAATAVGFRRPLVAA